MNVRIGRRAEDILVVLQTGRRKGEAAQSVEDADDQYLAPETDSELRQLAEVLLLARRQAVIQDLLDDDREALHHGLLSHEEHISVGQHYEMLRHQACSYNHLLRGFIESCSQHFSREDLMDWLTRASLGHDVWAKGEVTGAVSEIALHAALQGMPELHDVRYGSIEEDLSGYDFVSQWQGKLLSIDAKTGHYAPLMENKHGHKHLEISVPREFIDDLRIDRKDVARLRSAVRQALREGTGAAAVHVPHHYYQPNFQPAVV